METAAELYVNDNEIRKWRITDTSGNILMDEIPFCADINKLMDELEAE